MKSYNFVLVGRVIEYKIIILYKYQWDILINFQGWLSTLTRVFVCDKKYLQYAQ